MKHADLLGLLLPRPTYDPQGLFVGADLAAEGNALDSALAGSQRLLQAITPFEAGDMLPDWERLLGLVPPSGAPYQQRLEAVLAKLAETGGLSIPYFTRLAQRLGYSIAIDEPQPFRAGVNCAGDTLWIEDIIWVWHVDVQGASTRFYQFHAGQSAAGEALTSFADPVIEAIFNDLKPGHTFVYFTYQ